MCRRAEDSVCLLCTIISTFAVKNITQLYQSGQNTGRSGWEKVNLAHALRFRKRLLSYKTNCGDCFCIFI